MVRLSLKMTLPRESKMRKQGALASRSGSPLHTSLATQSLRLCSIPTSATSGKQHAESAKQGTRRRRFRHDVQNQIIRSVGELQRACQSARKRSSGVQAKRSNDWKRRIKQHIIPLRQHSGDGKK